MKRDVINNLFCELGPEEFLQNSLELFQFQMQQNAVYAAFCKALHISNTPMESWLQIPFLPIGLFKSHQIKTTAFEPEIVFESSGTTQTVPSRHFVKEISLYEHSFINGFYRQYGSPEEYCILALLPSYLEREHSSLVYMVQKLMEIGGHPDNGFFLNNSGELYHKMEQLEQQHQRVLLIGVTYALLDFAEQFPIRCKNTIVMETGGMKGRRKELIREEVHERLMKGFGVPQVHSEYGMTELLSQAYSKGDGVFVCPPWMKVLVREEDDPLQLQDTGRGVLNIIDLANVYSCSFIATDDVGEVFADGSFKVLGRRDNSDIRGCSLMAIS